MASPKFDQPDFKTDQGARTAFHVSGSEFGRPIALGPRKSALWPTPEPEKRIIAQIRALTACVRADIRLIELRANHGRLPAEPQPPDTPWTTALRGRLRTKTWALTARFSGETTCFGLRRSNSREAGRARPNVAVSMPISVLCQGVCSKGCLPWLAP